MAGLTKEQKAERAAAAAAAEENETVTIPENELPRENHKIVILVHGLVRIGKQDFVTDDVVEITDEQLHSQAIKYLFVKGFVEFLDARDKTREYVKEIRSSKRIKEQPEKTVEELEKGAEIK
jgi:hypothetical protein